MAFKSCGRDCVENRDAFLKKTIYGDLFQSNTAFVHLPAALNTRVQQLPRHLETRRCSRRTGARLWDDRARTLRRSWLSLFHFLNLFQLYCVFFEIGGWKCPYASKDACSVNTQNDVCPLFYFIFYQLLTIFCLFLSIVSLCFFWLLMSTELMFSSVVTLGSFSWAATANSELFFPLVIILPFIFTELYLLF